jgi:peroxin-1
MQIICKKLKLAESVDLEHFSTATPHFSGADLQALMHNAQLLAVHEKLDEKKKEKEEEASNTNNNNNAGKMPQFDVRYGDVSRPVSLATKLELQKLLQTEQKSVKDEAKIEENAKSVEIVVEQRHLDQAMAELRPSISELDRIKYDKIYGQCRSNHRDVDFKTGIEDDQPKQTLK